MALFNKLFISRKNNSSNQENASEDHFEFAKEQVRVVLFRECDFRGRKLLFDSTAIKKIQINSSLDNEHPNSSPKNLPEAFAEVSDGCGYMFIKPPSDSSQLAEMIFGLVAMSYRGSYFKIHNLETPSRLMLTQVFPSPKYSQRRKTSVSSHGQGRTSSQSFEHSIRLDDSGTSMSDHLSVHSTSSDTYLVCRHSHPLDVPQKYSGSSSSVVCDSGVYGERSCSSCDGSRHFSAVPIWESLPGKGSAVSFSNSTLYKRWLRSSSIDQSVTSSTGSMDETFSKPHQRSSKLGLAFIIHLTSGQEEPQVQFFMEHIALMESMLWRARQASEIAYLRPNNFLSVLMKMVNFTSIWLTNLLTGPLLPLNLWTSLCSNKSDSSNSTNNNIAGCDNINCNDVCSAKTHRETTDLFKSLFNSSNSSYFNSSGNFIDESTRLSNVLSSGQGEKSEFSFFNITKIIKNEWDYLNSKVFGTCDRNNVAGKFVQEFCELLETIDVKDTNFFISTLLTAVLTHHLGWVATCLPSDKESQILIETDIPFNPLWEQLCDLFGAVGHPTKMARTIIMGNKRKDVVSKIINCLTYFIRCCDLERHHIIRSDIYDDNKTADNICHKNSCIPKENYKKYKDHLREMLYSNNDDLSGSLDRKEDTVPKKGLSRTKKTHFDLKELENNKNCNIHPDSIRTSDTNGCINKNWNDLQELNNHVDGKSRFTFLENDSKVEIEGLTANKNDSVVFVLGDDEKLINIKKNENTRKQLESNQDEIKLINDETVKKASPSNVTRPNFLDLIFKKYETFEEEFSRSQFKDEHFVKYETDVGLKPSTSWASLQQAEEDVITQVTPKLIVENHTGFVRSQSVPPETKEKIVTEEVKAKYRYSGVKFSLHQYPQVVTNYMRSKNLEMANLTFSEITKKFDQISLENEEINLDFSQYDVNSDEMVALQTPSNASELEFTSDLTMDMPKHHHARESSEKPPCITSNTPVTSSEDNTAKYPQKLGSSDDLSHESLDDISTMKIIYFPMPKSELASSKTQSIPYPLSLIRGLNDNYIPDLVLQGISAPRKDWEPILKNELALTSQHCLLNQHLEEAVAIVADTDTWEVHLMSSHTYVIDKSSSGVRVGMSQLISSMLDSLLKMWRLQVPPQLCLMHIEQRLQALCVRSKTLAQLLLATEFCSMELLTSTLHLEVNDVPLLLAVASTYSPQVTQKYGISFH